MTGSSRSETSAVPVLTSGIATDYGHSRNAGSPDSFSRLQRLSRRATVRTKPCMTGGAPLVCCGTLATSGRPDAPHASPFAERSAPNTVLPLKAGEPSWA